MLTPAQEAFASCCGDGTIQAAEAIWVIRIVSLSERLPFDALSMEFMRHQAPPHCPVCGDQPTIKGLIDYDEFCGAAAVR
jgi:adenylyltransferase/sulfurtransferase